MSTPTDPPTTPATPAGAMHEQTFNEALAGFPISDFAAYNDAGQQARAIAREHIGELATLELQPASYAFHDANRHRIDAVALAMIGLGENQQAGAAIDALRQQWCREPAAHGGTIPIMQALGIA